jgi:hypothetical protein
MSFCQPIDPPWEPRPPESAGGRDGQLPLLAPDDLLRGACFLLTSRVCVADWVLFPSASREPAPSPAPIPEARGSEADGFGPTSRSRGDTTVRGPPFTDTEGERLRIGNVSKRSFQPILL